MPDVRTSSVHATVPAETANDRLKRDADAWLPRGIIIAVAVHVALFAFAPDLTVAEISGSARDEFIVVPPALDLPPAPEMLRRPALPQVSTADLHDDVTIPPTRFEDWPAERLDTPVRAKQDAREEFHQFMPSMIAPRLLNAAAVERALQQNYPTLLREAGVGGNVDVSLWLDADGTIVRAEVARSSGHVALDEAALRVVNVMRLSPALSMGTATRVIVTLPIVFRVQ
jgi:TonB family protein